MAAPSAPVAEPKAPAEAADAGDDEPEGLLARRLPFWLFVAYLVVAGPLILWHIGAYHWFFRDDWSFIADRGNARLPPLLKPNGGAHWVAVPRMIYLVLWKLVGVTSYRPYQACVVAVHLAGAALLRAVMRRAGVHPWLATAAAAGMVLFGPGQQNIVWAFQVGFTGSMTYGLAQLLLADHDGGLDRRDLYALGFGLLAITSSGVGVTMAVAVGVALLVRRGWRPAALHALPLLVIYAGWAKLEHVKTSPFGRPGVSDLFAWDRSSATGAVSRMGYVAPLGWAIVAVALAGVVLLALRWRATASAERQRRLAGPVGLAVGAAFFATTTGVGRWYTGASGAQSSRYIYLEVALLLPIVALGFDQLRRRWPVVLPVLAVLLLAPVPFNATRFDPGVFGPKYMAERRRILTTAVRMPFAGDVPKSVQPVPDPYDSDAVTIGFLLQAKALGRLHPSTTPLTPSVVNEFRIRLGLEQREARAAASSCRQFSGPYDVDLRKGQAIYIADKVQVLTRAKGKVTSPPVPFDPALGGNELQAQLPVLHLRLRHGFLASTFVVCRLG